MARLIIYNPNGSVNFDSEARWGLVVYTFSFDAFIDYASRTSRAGGEVAMPNAYANMRAICQSTLTTGGWFPQIAPIAWVEGNLVKWRWPATNWEQGGDAQVLFMGATVQVVIM